MDDGKLGRFGMAKEDLERLRKIWEDMGRFGKAREDLERLGKTWEVL